jgi:hypothetical protein
MNAVEAGLYTALTGGTALLSTLGGTAIYNGVAPRGVSVPYVVFSLASGIEENMTPTDSQRLVYLVKGVAATLVQAGTIADQVNALLHDQELTVSGSVNFWTSRETIVRYTEVQETGRTLGHAGGEYLIRVVEE